MKRLASINVMLQAITILMAIALLATLGLSAKHALDRRQAAARALHVVDVSRDLFVAIKNFRVERGTVNTALATAESTDPAFTAKVSRLRQQSGQALDSALSKLGLLESASVSAEVHDVLVERAVLAALRSRADAALRLEKSQRPETMSAEWISSCDRLVNAVDKLSGTLSEEVIRTDPFLAEMMKVKQLAWTARAAAGTDRLRIGEAIAGGGSISDAGMRDLAELKGHTAAAWSLIEHDARQLNFPPKLAASIRSADSIYFGALGGRRAKILDRLIARESVDISGADWVRLSNPGLDALVVVAYSAFDEAKAHATEQLRAAERDLYAASLLLALVVVLTALSVFFIVTRVARPMTAIADAMNAVATGDLSGAIPFRRRDDEIGELSRALAMFREHAIERQRMADELVRSRVAKEAAEAANSVKSQFLANMSHEIRTPLNGVLGMAQVMELGDPTPVQREQLRIIREAGASLLQILNDVLDLAKIEAGKFELSLDTFDVAELTRGVAAIYADVAAAKSLEFTWAVSEDATGPWFGDLLRIRQILMNLMSNAVKFTEHGNISLEVESNESVLTFAIRDTGIGMAADQLPKLFEKFSQVDESNTRRFGGTGLGLAICRQLAELMDGEIGVETQPDVGSVFYLRLPLRRADRVAASDTMPSEGWNAAPAPDARSPRILVAEDNLINQTVLKALLAPMQVELTIVDNGLEVVDAWASGPWDLILMDIQMPGQSGVAATHRIRALELEQGRPVTPIIALSANAMSHQVKDYLAAGMTAHIAKPIDTKALYDAIHTALVVGERAESREVA